MIKRKLIICAGHNRAGFKSYPHLKDTGAIYGTHEGKKDNEHWLMERVASGAYQELKGKYDNVVLMDFTYNLKGKIDWINKNCTKYDCVIEIHANASVNKEVTGSEVFYVKNGRRSKTYAENISEIISHNIGTKNRGHKTSNFTRHGRLGIIDDTISYDFLVELGFMSNYSDYDKIKKNGVRATVKACEYILDKIQPI